mgnify:CR=1 FL=1|tara:strand:- start:405 stop:818 length:414 start_codon:yes stop_codon:yes gene_type:complete
MNFKKIIFLTSFVALSSCSAIVPTGTETTFKYLGIAKGAADAVSYQKTGKTVNDHLLSAAVGKDCKITNIVKKQPICVEMDPRSQKYSIFNKGKVVSKNNIVRMKFPSEIYEFNKTLEEDLKKKLKNPNLRLLKKQF